VIEGFLAQRRVSRAPFEVSQQFTGEMRFLRELGAAHDFGKRLLRSELGCRQLLDGIVFQFNCHCRHEQNLPEKGASFKVVSTRTQRSFGQRLTSPILRLFNPFMFHSRLAILPAFACLLLGATSSCEGRVARFEITSRQEILNGRAFGLAGSFERITGKVHFAVDPVNTANQIITDIKLAPRNSRGEVEFAADFFLIKPKDIARGNGTLLYEVSNRGGKGMLSFFNLATGSLNPETEAHFGDGFLLREGYCLLWVGWQFDPPRRDGLMRLYPPFATNSNGPIRGLVRSDFVVTNPVFAHSLADR